MEPELPDRFWSTDQQRWVYPGEMPMTPKLPDLYTFEEYPDRHVMYAADVYAFSEAMAQYAEARVAAERERCAGMADNMKPTGGRAWSEGQAACFLALDDLAAAIRKGA